MSEPSPTQTAPATPELVEPRVRALLTLSPAYRRLSPDRQRQIANDTVRIGVYMAEPEGLRANRLAGTITTVPARPGTQVVGDFLDDINFPVFVAALIQGVFQAIVNVSIQQMEAYGELVETVTKTIDHFMKEYVYDGDARDWLAETYPDYFDRDVSSGALRLRPGVARAEAIQRFEFLPLDCSLKTLDPPDVEKTLVPAARRGIVANPQQLLATMVLMGINRIIGTDSVVGAKLGFTTSAYNRWTGVSPHQGPPVK